MAKDWLTGQPLEKQGPNPVASFLAGLMQAQAMKQEREEAERIQAQKQAMGQIQEGRTLLERLAQMDPTLWADGGFVDAWKAGDITYPAKTGWKPPAPKPSYPDKEVGGNIVRLDPETGTYKTVYEGKPAAPEYKYVMLPWGNGQKQGRVGPNGYEVQDSKGQWVPLSGVTPGKPTAPSPDNGEKGTYKNLIGPDQKTHSYFIPKGKERDKTAWVDMGLVGGATLNVPEGKEWLEHPVGDGTYMDPSRGYALVDVDGNPVSPKPKPTPTMDDEDALLLEEIRGYLKP